MGCVEISLGVRDVAHDPKNLVHSTGWHDKADLARAGGLLPILPPKSLTNKKRICYTCPVAKRPDFSKQVLSREDLAALQGRLSSAKMEVPG